jgi:hypothetical protein
MARQRQTNRGQKKQLQCPRSLNGVEHSFVAHADLPSSRIQIMKECVPNFHFVHNCT